MTTTMSFVPMNMKEYGRKQNRSGGIQGGISNGETINVRNENSLEANIYNWSKLLFDHL